jgi:hypothetical protein
MQRQKSCKRDKGIRYGIAKDSPRHVWHVENHPRERKSESYPMTEAWKTPIIHFRTNQADDNHNEAEDISPSKNGDRIRDKSSWMMKRYKNVKQGKMLMMGVN